MFVKGFQTRSAVQHGRLTYWPLEGPDTGLGFVGQVRLVKDLGYDSLRLKSTNGPAIAPWGMTFFISGAQDRALREAVYIPMGQEVYAEAVCVEPRQCGLWSCQQVEVGQLPPSLLAALPEGGGFSALWPGIKSRYRGKSGDTVAGLLEGKVSHDVPVSGARGVVVGLDGRPVALYVAPSAAAFAEWWNGGLGQSLAFETTYPELPLPLGSVNEPLEFTEGLHKVEAWEVLVGWAFVSAGVLAYATLVDGEALSSFQKAREQKMEEWEC